MLAHARDIAAIAGIYLYFAGWTYQVYYLRGFGIASDATTSVESTLTFAVNVFAQPYAAMAKLISMTILVALGVGAYRLPSWRTYLIAAAALLCFPLIQLVAYHSAQGIIRARLSTNSFTRVRFIQNPGSGLSLDKELLPLEGVGSLCIAHRTETHYYVFRCPSWPDLPANVFEIKVDSADLIRLTPARLPR